MSSPASRLTAPGVLGMVKFAHTGARIGPAEASIVRDEVGIVNSFWDGSRSLIKRILARDVWLQPYRDEVASVFTAMRGQRPSPQTAQPSVHLGPDAAAARKAALKHLLANRREWEARSDAILEWKRDEARDPALLAAIDVVCACDFTGDAFFDPLDARAFLFATPAIFRGVSFADEAWFNACRFVSSVDFQDAVFRRQATFEASHFMAEARFSQARFMDRAEMRQIKAYGDTHFDRARFDDDLWLSRSEFAGRVSFDRAHFGKEAGLGGCTFAREASFAEAVFGAGAGFEDVRFAAGADFSGAHFDGTAWFSRARFKEAPDFAAASARGRIEIADVEIATRDADAAPYFAGLHRLSRAVPN